ncbi:MAG: hypothetical protein JO109_13845, partial [Alphaproteobacteria bacterium]|nr:hypothetical protein [Alphaproteobacteria bacterium]
MADLPLLFTADKKSAAAQLAEAARGAGYPLRLEEVAAADGAAVLARAGAGAALLLWSRTLAGAAVTDGWLAALRSLPNVIEVSTDGIAPDTGEVGRVVLLSGWRGQPYHLGWQRIVERLARLVPRSPPQGPAPAPAETRAAGPRPGKRLRIALPALGIAALVAAAGAVSWNESRSLAPAPVEAPGPPSAAAPAPVPPPAPTPGAMPSAPAPGPGPAEAMPSPRPVREVAPAPAEPAR